jgi:hypothetical protein
MLKQAYTRLALKVLASVLALPLASCGSMLTVGVGLDDRHDGYNSYWDTPQYLFDGVWQGKYVYYQGEWHYKGYGTPYIYDPWDPYW